MSSESPDLFSHLLDAIRAVRPDIVSDGQPDLAKLKAALKPRYGLTWKEQPEHEVDAAERQGIHPLLSLSVGDSLLDYAQSPAHALIEGDNYHALKVLNYTHARKVDVIYIDPPYNTGNKDFRYNDCFVEKDDSFRHSKWLSFMAKRLALAKSLLRETGAILVSVDDNEQANLKLLLDDVFDEANYVTEFIWKTRGVKGAPKHGGVIVQHEKIFVYAKNKSHFSFVKDAHPNAGSESWLGYRKTGGAWQQEHRPNQCFPFFYDERENVLTLTRQQNLSAIEIWPMDTKGALGFWHNSPPTAQEKLDANLLRARKVKGRWAIEYKEVKKDEIAFGSVIDDIPSSRGSAQLADMGLSTFNNPKPLELMALLLRRVLPGSSGLVLDFFAGSGTTAHAVMQLNAEDDGTRQCILITNDEGEFKGTEGITLPGGICTHVTRPRLARAIKGYRNAACADVPGLRQNLVFLKTSMYHPKTNKRGVYVEYKQFLIEAIDLLRFKEGALVEQKPYHSGDKNTWDEDEPWGVYSSLDGSKTLVVLLDEDAIDSCVEFVATLPGEVALYPFTYEEDTSAQSLCSARELGHVKVHPVPGNLLKTYRRLNRK